MSQVFSKRADSDDTGIDWFTRDGVEVHATAFFGHDHAAATTVFTPGGATEVFHADKHCYRLYLGDPYTAPDGARVYYPTAYPLEVVMTTWGKPNRPCSHCTADMETTVDVVTTHDNVPESSLKYPSEAPTTDAYHD